MKRRFVLALPLLGVAGGLRAAPPHRIVSLGGTVTEIVHALHADERLVGVDSSSLYPPAATQLPQVGYYRGFSVEGVLSLQPDLILASDQAGPPRALEQLRRLGLPVVLVPSKPDLESLGRGIDRVATALGLDEQGQALARQLREQLAAAARPPALAEPAPRVLLLSSHTGWLQAAGRHTAADALLALAGGVNAFGDQQGYKAVSAEAVAALKPEAIVTTTRSIASAGGVAAFATRPGIAVTPAAQAGRIVVLDDLLLLGFGPRLPQALQQLRAGLFGAAARREHQPAVR